MVNCCIKLGLRVASYILFLVYLLSIEIRHFYLAINANNYKQIELQMYTAVVVGALQIYLIIRI
jgi:hypothetical protein